MTITNRVSLKSVEFGVTSIDDVVDAPTIGTATAGTEQATVTFTPAATGGAATSFTAISTPGSITGSAASSPITVTGLTGDTAYTFKVYGTNASGTWSAVQSAASNSVTPTVSTTSFESIATVTVGAGGQSTAISFTSIPSTYKHLQFRYILRSTSGSGAFNTTCRFNNDTTSTNYAGHRLQGNGSAAASGAQTGNGWAWFGPYTNGTEAGSNIFSVGVVDILDYANTNKAKTIRSIGGYDANGSGYAMMTSGLWTSTSAINRVDIQFETSPSSYPFAQYSQIALYGVKG